MAVKVKVGSLTSIYTGSTDKNVHPEFPLPKVDSIETEDEMAVKVKVGSLTSIYTGTEQQIKVVLLFLRIIFTEKQIEIKKTIV